MTLGESGKLSGCSRDIGVKEESASLICLSYLNRFSEAVDYDYFRAIGLPIGSGEVESAIALHSLEEPENPRGDMAPRTGTRASYRQKVNI